MDGLYRVDARGVIRSHVSRAAPGSPLAVGRRFFDEVARCGDNGEFRGRFEAMLARGGGAETFRYDRCPVAELRVRIFGCNSQGAWIVIASQPS